MTVHVCLAKPTSTRITVRIPLELKKRMERFRDVNWSDVTRRAIEEKLRELEIREAV